MKINILHKGDEVINVTQDFIAVRRKNGEVDIIGLLNDEMGLHIDTDNFITISYGNNTVESELTDGVVITNF